MSSEVIKAEVSQGEKNLNIPISVPSEQVEHLEVCVHTYQDNADQIVMPMETLQSLLFSGSSVISQIQEATIQGNNLVLKVELDISKMPMPDTHPVVAHAWDVFKTGDHDAVTLSQELFLVHPGKA